MKETIICPKCGMLKKNCICKGGLIFSDEIQKRNLKKEHPHIPDKIIENFPFPRPRPGQLDIINDIYEAIEGGYKYIILEAGTGTGKSAIAITLARIYQPAYILTMTKQLQDQYAREFRIPTVKGRSNFYCKSDDLESTCDIGVCQTTPSSENFQCPYGVSRGETLFFKEAFKDSHGNKIYFKSREHCQYWEQKAHGINSPITLMNYDYAFLELNYVGHFGKRKLMVLDEAHNIENKLMQRLEVNLSNKRLEKDIKKRIPDEMFEEDDPKEWILPIDAISQDYKDLDKSQMSKRRANRMKRMIKRLDELKKSLEKEPKNWVIDTNHEKVSFKPLQVDKYAPRYLFSHADICLFMSATILSDRMFCKWLGINPEESFFLKVDSPFPASRRPIELKLIGRMSKNRIKDTAPKTIPILKRILERHKYDKGLIHTHNYRCQKFILKNIPDDRLIGHKIHNREEMLKYFEESEKPLVLVSPSMSEGVDLPYDKCRFQVIYKIPFPYLGDKQVNMRQKRDKKWYAYKTVMTLMQAYGRGMRAHDDECYTYILDANITMLFRSPLYRSLLPQFFKEAIIE
ncbi:MAG: ATP-dependent DNA helicase [Methanobacteriales archaeon]|nr:ATP-dependent DNA helicase [Methanobacteriales archaeon]